MEVKVIFFGVLAEVTGTTFLSFTGIKNMSDLRFKVTDAYPEIIHYNYRIAVNGRFTENDNELPEGAEVAFLPPFAGG